MPLFRYECKDCGNEFRVLQQQGDDTPVMCPNCLGTDLHRLPSRVSVQFKGSGYYKTDRANKKSKAGTKGLSEKETSETSLESSSKDSKDSGSASDPKKPASSSTAKKVADSGADHSSSS